MKILFITAILLSATASFSQNGIAKLGLGDKVPAGILDTHKGKLVILDFWSKSCTVCIEAMPKMEELQQKFGERVKIILVTRNSDEEVEKVFKRVTIKKPNLPFINHDSTLSKLFPYLTVPHHVWIDSGGNVLYITDGYNASEKNIEAVLAGKKMNFEYKNQFFTVDPAMSLLSQPEGNLKDHLLEYSFFMDRISEAKGSFLSLFYDTVAAVKGLRIVNTLLRSLYTAAFGSSIYDSPFMFDNRVLLLVADKERFSTSTSDENLSNWLNENMFSYESLMKIENSQDIYTRLREDLHRHFGYEAKVEQRKMKALVLTRTSAKDKIKSIGGPIRSENLKDGGRLYLNQSFSGVFFRYLAYSNQHLASPIIDKTGYKHNIDIRIESSFSDIPKLNKELSKYDLKLSDEIINVPILVIRDKLNKKP